MTSGISSRSITKVKQPCLGNVHRWVTIHWKVLMHEILSVTKIQIRIANCCKIGCGLILDRDSDDYHQKKKNDKVNSEPEFPVKFKLCMAPDVDCIRGLASTQKLKHFLN